MSEVEQHNETTGTPKRSRMTKWIMGGVLLMFAVAAAMNLPRGFSDDLSRTGKGQASVVLIRDKNAVQTFELIDVMNAIRDKYDGRVEFLLTDFNTPEGRAFMTANNASRLALVLLDANGKPVKILYSPQTAESVQQEIDGMIGTAPTETIRRAPE